MSKEHSPQKREREANPEDDFDQAAQPTKRQRLNEQGEAKTIAPPKPTEEEDGSYHKDKGGSDDSFDEDFDASEEEGVPGPDDENFDKEAYAKWCAEHPEGDSDFDAGEEGEFEFEEGEMEEMPESELDGDDSEAK